MPADRRCPLCGSDNGCAMAVGAAGDRPCWCATVRITAAALARVPVDERGRVCICAACANATARDDRQP